MVQLLLLTVEACRLQDTLGPRGSRRHRHVARGLVSLPLAATDLLQRPWLLAKRFHLLPRLIHNLRRNVGHLRVLGHFIEVLRYLLRYRDIKILKIDFLSRITSIHP